MLKKVRQRRSRIAQWLNVPPGKSCQSSSGRVGEKNYASPLRHWALTISRPSANVTLIILRVADLAAALLDRLFEHPAVFWRSAIRTIPAILLASTEFSATC